MLILHIADYCTLPPDKGNCSEVQYQYFFSPEHQRCFMFVYGGCEGNENNFDSLYSCMRKCSGKYPNEDETEVATAAGKYSVNMICIFSPITLLLWTLKIAAELDVLLPVWKMLVGLLEDYHDLSSPI
jgi:hypothetical protein